MTVLTAFTSYTKNTISNFVNSLNDTGFAGRKIVIYYDPVKSIEEYLIKNGWEVFTYPKPKYYVNFQRRKESIEIIDKLNLNNQYICCADMKDVYFTKSISDIKEDFYLEKDVDIPFSDHEWNRETIEKGYPNYYDKLKNNIPLNSGIIIGKGKILKEFFEDFIKTGLKSKYTNIDKKTPGLDQSTVNLLVYTKYKHLLTSNKKYVLHMGNLDNNENLDGYHMYHQYERNKKHMQYVVNLNKKSYI